MNQQIPPWLTVQGEDLRLDVIVSPKASKTRIMGVHDDRLKIQVAAPPADGKANEALVRFLAERLDIPRAQVEILGGAANTRKSIRLYRVTAHHAIMRLTPSKGI